MGQYPIVCPAILSDSEDPSRYKTLIEKVSFASRVQVDLMDGIFAPHHNINPIQLWWPESMVVDIHLMYQSPGEHLETLVSLNPHMIIFHYESQGDVLSYIQHVKRFGIKAGIALLPETTVERATKYIYESDHVLLFAGRLGEQSAGIDMSVLDKVAQVRNLRHDIEIGWDGGINRINVAMLADGGIDVLNVGGALWTQDDIKLAYDDIVDQIRVYYHRM
ncbi:MAG: hypothetical protein WAW60_00440 [Candidatus Saccharimonadales bacterium]